MVKYVLAILALVVTHFTATAGDKILISADRELYMTDTVSENTTLLYNVTGVVSSIDYHYNKGYLYYTFENYIMRRNISSPLSQPSMKLIDTGTVYGLAVDWINNHIYWTNSHGNEIEMANLDGSQRTSVIGPKAFEGIKGLANTTLLYDINLDPYDKIMFAIAGDSRESLKGTLVSAYLNGSSLRSISDPVYRIIITFAIDHHGRRLFCTGHKDERAFFYFSGYNGVSKFVVPSTGSEMWVNPLRAFIDKLYLLHNYNSPESVVRDELNVFFFGPDTTEVIFNQIDTPGLSHIYDMRVYDEKEQMSMDDFLVYRSNIRSKAKPMTSTTPENLPINSSNEGVTETGTALVNETHQGNQNEEDVQHKKVTQNTTSVTNIEQHTTAESRRSHNYIAVALFLLIVSASGGAVFIVKRYYFGKAQQLFQRKRLTSEDRVSIELDD